VFAATLNFTLPGPVTDVAPAGVIKDAELDAVHAQDAPALTDIVKSDAPAATAAAGFPVTVKLQLGGVGSEGELLPQAAANATATTAQWTSEANRRMKQLASLTRQP